MILASGGFGANCTQSTWLATYRPDLLHFATTNGEHCAGDAVKIGEAIGAKTTDRESLSVCGGRSTDTNRGVHLSRVQAWQPQPPRVQAHPAGRGRLCHTEVTVMMNNEALDIELNRLLAQAISELTASPWIVDVTDFLSDAAARRHRGGERPTLYTIVNKIITVTNRK